MDLTIKSVSLDVRQVEYIKKQLPQVALSTFVRFLFDSYKPYQTWLESKNNGRS
jgi:hypothetical protein